MFFPQNNCIYSYRIRRNGTEPQTNLVRQIHILTDTETDIFCCRPNCLELTERWSAWSDA